jgi:large subunit ribosomal protein L21
MYAIFNEGGRQITVREGDVVEIDYRRDLAPGAEITFDLVLMIGGDAPQVGAPTVKGASVVAVVKAQVKGVKVRGNKPRLHDRSQTHWGHRQKYTAVEIKKINSR